MKLKLIRTMWGVLDAAHHATAAWEPVFSKLRNEGYEGIEFCVGPFNPFACNQKLFSELIAKYEFQPIAQIHTCSYPLASHKVEDHIESFRALVKEAKAWGATFVNSHSGSDTWTHEQSIRFFTACLQIEKEAGITVVHETHRRRVFYNPFATRDVLRTLPQLQINLDISHWVVVCERVFNEQDEADWWNEVLEMVANNAQLIHARVGYSDGPQVPDPSAEEWDDTVDAHLKWWGRVWTGMARRGLQTVYVEPEHGPSPYMHVLPHTGMPVADLWAVNSWVGRKVVEHFRSFSADTVYKC